MLRISVSRPSGGTTLVLLEGRLAGPWVGEVDRCFKSVAAESGDRPLRVDLQAVTFIDAEGKAVLRTMVAHGATLHASGCMTRAVVDEITTQASGRRGADAGGGG